jgi:hypothetical protein
MNSYPDEQSYSETKIKSVRELKDGYELTYESGWSFYITKESGVVPVAGMVVRQYPDKATRVRGLFIDGRKVFYLTEEEQKEKDEHDRYGTIPQDVIDKWDDGDTIWSIDMGGFGPGYEQALQHCAIEILRWMIKNNLDHSGWEADGALESVSNQASKPVCGLFEYGFSGAQWGAALNIAARIFKYGPRSFASSIPNDRKIQVSKHWPRLKEAS